ncbi:MAG: hypothetical protein SZ59_C0003G0078 [candidate division TM6 bacterium GW2011_GWF2_28_16]|nr:MAG: hypothetical protein SZ59_C0003G0078 [candidate division TM6 bacterium GW2011_GWF2_28_16]
MKKYVFGAVALSLAMAYSCAIAGNTKVESPFGDIQFGLVVEKSQDLQEQDIDLNQKDLDQIKGALGYIIQDLKELKEKQPNLGKDETVNLIQNIVENRRVINSENKPGFVKRYFLKFDKALDYMLTVKGFIKTQIILSPIYITILYLFGPEMLNGFIETVVGYSSNAAAKITDAIIDSIEKNKDKIMPMIGKSARIYGEMAQRVSSNQEVGKNVGIWNNWDLKKAGTYVANGIKWVIPLFIGELIKAKTGAAFKTADILNKK